MKVLITFDVEVWCQSWDTLEEDFPSSFDRYVYGRSDSGSFALPKTLEVLDRHGLKAVFFVEPLFAARFGTDALATVVKLIRDAGQEVQLHLHPEWTDEALTPLLDGVRHKRQYMHLYDEDEQATLIAHGLRLMREVGQQDICAFRSGGFSCNASTLRAVARSGLAFDSSVNPTLAVSTPGALGEPAAGASEPYSIGALGVVPLTCFRDGFGRLRHAQVGACSADELTQAMESASQRSWDTFVLLSHNFELLMPGTTKPDAVVVRRYEALCDFLGRNRRDLPTVGFADMAQPSAPRGLQPPGVGMHATVKRYAEQALRRLH